MEMGVHDIMKPMVLNEIKKAREEEYCHSQSKETTNFVPRLQSCQPLVTWTMIGIELFRPPPMKFSMVQMARHPPNFSGIIGIPPLPLTTPC